MIAGNEEGNLNYGFSPHSVKDIDIEEETLDNLGKINLVFNDTVSQLKQSDIDKQLTKDLPLMLNSNQIELSNIPM